MKSIIEQILLHHKPAKNRTTPILHKIFLFSYRYSIRSYKITDFKDFQLFFQDKLYIFHELNFGVI